MSLRDAWLELFPAGKGPAAGVAADDLIARWSEPQRHYHTAAHLERMLTIVDASADQADDPDAVRLACWFHDAVYDPTRMDNEIRSAELAASVLAGLDQDRARVAEVVRLIYLTSAHAVDDGDRNGALLCDADLAILGTAPAEYATYARAVRKEYRHVADDAFAAGRIAVLGKLLDLSEIYHLPAHRAAWEQPARANMTGEIRALRGQNGS